MNAYGLLPMLAFFSNICLGCYILYRNPKGKLNILYALVAFEIALWSIGDFMTISSSTSEAAIRWESLSALGSALVPAFMLHFFLVFTRSRLASRRIVYLSYIPAFVFIFLDMTTNYIRGTTELNYWGYWITGGILYIPFAVCMVMYILAGLFVCYRFYARAKSEDDKVRAKLVMIAISVPLVGGVLVEVAPIFFGSRIIPVTSTLTTITAFIVAYAVIRHSLMTPSSSSIKRKLVGGFLVIVVSVALGGIIYAEINKDVLEKAIGENSVNMAASVVRGVDMSIQRRAEAWEMYTETDSVLQETLKNSNREFERLDDIRKYVEEKDSEWTSVPRNTTTRFMQNILDNELSRELSKSMEFYEKKEGYKVFGEVFVTNKYGANVAQTGKTSDYRQDDELWWQEAKENGLYIDGIEYDESAGIYSTALCIRIDDEDGNFIGVMKAVLNVMEVFDAIERVKESSDYESMNVLLFTKDWKTIYGGDDVSYVPLLLGSNEKSDGYEIVVTGRENKDLLLAYAYSKGYKDFKGLGWIAVLVYETEDLFAPVTQSTIIMFLITTSIMIFAVLISIFLSRSITAPIIRLRNAVEKIGKGEMNAEIDVGSNDELGELASAFRQMTIDLKKYHKKIREHSRKLEEEVQKRTKELDSRLIELTKTKTAVLNMMEDMDDANKELVETQEELRKSLKELKDTDIKKDQFISIAAHELKTPLTSIHGFSQLLQNRKISNNFTKRNNYLKIMDHETKRLATLVNDILDLSRVDLNTIRISTQKIDLNNLVDNVKKEMSVQIKQKGLVFEQNIGRNLPKIITDPERLMQILLNLLNNSVKYTEKGKITLEVHADREGVHFFVKDTGIGIPDDEKEKIFERFYQVDSSYTRKAGGTGLGLALTKEFVKILGGEISVESVEGKGSTFSFTLPMKAPETQYER